MFVIIDVISSEWKRKQLLNGLQEAAFFSLSDFAGVFSG